MAVPSHPSHKDDSSKPAPLPEAEPEPDQTGLLVVHSDIVKKCSIKEALPLESSWRGVLQSIAACMNRGKLRSRRVFLQGDESARATVGYVLAKMGIDEKRVVMKTPVQTNGRDEATIDIALTMGEVTHDGTSGISVRVNRHEMVAFLAEDIVE